MNKWLMGGGIAVLAAIGVALGMRGLQSVVGNGDGGGKHDHGQNEALLEIEKLADQLMIDNPGWTREEALAEAARLWAQQQRQDFYNIPDPDPDADIIREAEEIARDAEILATDLIATVAKLRKDKESLRRKANELDKAAAETQKEVDRIEGELERETLDDTERSSLEAAIEEMKASIRDLNDEAEELSDKADEIQKKEDEEEEARRQAEEEARLAAEKARKEREALEAKWDAELDRIENALPGLRASLGKAESLWRTQLDRMNSVQAKIDRYRSSTGSHAILFEHEHYGGKAVSLHPGEYNNLSKYGFNDKCSSLRVNANYVLKLYEHDNFNGHEDIFFQDDPNQRFLVRPSMSGTACGNDNVSSAKLIMDTRHLDAELNQAKAQADSIKINVVGVTGDVNDAIQDMLRVTNELKLLNILNARADRVTQSYNALRNGLTALSRLL